MSLKGGFNEAFNNHRYAHHHHSSYYYNWIVCTVENAQKGKTHRDVERACFRKVKQYDPRSAFPIFKEEK